MRSPPPPSLRRPHAGRPAGGDFTGPRRVNVKHERRLKTVRRPRPRPLTAPLPPPLPAPRVTVEGN